MYTWSVILKQLLIVGLKIQKCSLFIYLLFNLIEFEWKHKEKHINKQQKMDKTTI